MALLLASRTANAQGVARQTGWKEVRGLKAQSKVAIELTDGTMLTRKVENVSDTGLTLLVKGRRRDIAQTDSRNVYHIRRRIGRTTWRGTLVGYRITAPFRHFLGGGRMRQHSPS